MAYPTDLPEWDTNDSNSTEPPAQYKTDGLPERVPLTYDYLNWMLSRTWTWIDWLRDGSKLWVASDEVSSQTAETAIDSFLIPAGALADERTLLLRVLAEVTHNTGTFNLTLKVRLGLSSDALTSRPILAMYAITNPAVGYTFDLDTIVNVQDSETNIQGRTKGTIGTTGSGFATDVQRLGTFASPQALDCTQELRCSITASWSGGPTVGCAVVGGYAEIKG